MRRKNPTVAICRVAWRWAAAVLLAGVPTAAPQAQQPAAGIGGSAHAATPSGARTGGEGGIRIGLPSRQPTKQDPNIQAPQFLRIVPPNERSIGPAESNAIGRDAIGAPVVRHNGVPAAPFIGNSVVRAPIPQSGAGSGLGVRSGGIGVGPAAQPLASSRGAIGGTSFTRPGATLLPLGGPAKPGATSINGTSIRPKH
jgi:hypothetical protein